MMEMDALHIYTDASCYRVGTIIIPTGECLLEASSQKLVEQTNYPAEAEKEMLSIILFLKTFHTTIIVGSNKTGDAVIQMLGVMDRLLHHIRLSDPPENLPSAPFIEPEPPPPGDDSCFEILLVRLPSGTK